MRHALLFILPLAACQTAGRGGPEPPAAAGVPAGLLGDPDATVAVSIWLMDSPRLYADASAARADRRVEMLSAPRLILRPFEQGSLSVLEDHSYVSRLEVQAGSGTLVAGPVVEVLRSGTVVDVIAYPRTDGRWSGWVRLGESRLERLDEGRIALADSPLTIQLPETTSWNRARLLPPRRDGHWLVDLGRSAPGRWRLLEVAMQAGPPAPAATDAAAGR